MLVIVPETGSYEQVEAGLTSGRVEEIDRARGPSARTSAVIVTGAPDRDRSRSMSRSPRGLSR
jgi:hypothetical protein